MTDCAGSGNLPVNWPKLLGLFKTVLSWFFQCVLNVILASLPLKRRKADISF